MYTSKKQKQVSTILGERLPLNTPFTICFDPCGACNFTCSFCPCNNSDYNAKERHKMMSMEVFHKMVSDIKEFDEKIKVINFYSQGEPLLNPNLPEMIKIVKDADICERLMMVTNGSLLTPELNQKLIDAGLDNLRISIEGLDSASYKNVCKYDLDFDELCANIKDYYERSRNKSEIVAKIVSLTLNGQEDAQKFYDIFGPITDYRYIEKVADNMWPNFEAKQKKEAAADIAEAGTLAFDHVPDKMYCADPFIYMFIYSSGNIGLCCNDWAHDSIIANIMDDSLKNIWNSDKFNHIRLALLEGGRQALPICRNCYRKPDRKEDILDDYIDVLIPKFKKQLI